MKLFNNLYNMFEDSDGWIKLLVCGLLLALGLAGFFGWNTIKEFTELLNNPTEQVIDDTTEALEEGKQQLEEQKQELIDQGNETLEQGRQVLEDGKQKLDEVKEQTLEKTADFIQSLKH